jgi:hypothetical protein
MSEITPGPWSTISYDDSDGATIVSPPVDGRIVVIAEVECGANAALIRAAPDLLAACEAALSVIEAMIEYPGDPCRKIADGLRAALQQVRDILRREVGDRSRSELAEIIASGYGQWPLCFCVVLAENALSGTPVIDVKRVALRSLAAEIAAIEWDGDGEEETRLRVDPAHWREIVATLA